MSESDSSLLRRSIRKEVQAYLLACEQLIEAAATPDGFQLSRDEVDMLVAYEAEIHKLVKQSSSYRS